MQQSEEFFARVLLEHDSIDQNYQATFAEEGGRKVRDLIEPTLRRLQREGRYVPEHAVVVSVGCADGSDVAHMLRERLVGHAVGIEFSHDGATRARKIAIEFASSSNPRMEVLQGDAMQLLDELRTRLLLLEHRGFDTVVLLLFGVLHELPTRSPNFSFHQLVGTACGTLPYAVVGLNEPSAIQGWKGRQRIIVDFCKTPRSIILAHAQMTAGAILGCRIDPTLADPSALRPLQPARHCGRGLLEIDVGHFAEMLQKIRNSSAARMRYELAERTAWLGPEAVACMLASVHGFETEVLLRTSSGIRSTWDNLAVKVQ